MNRRRFPVKSLVFLIIIVLVGMLVNRLLYSTSIIIIEGKHNPVTARLFVDKKRLFPSGKEGRTYKLRARHGSYKVVVGGPDVKKSDASIKIEAFSSNTITVVTTTRTIQDAANEAIKPADGVSLPDIRTFDSDWLAVRADDGNPLTDDKLYVARYNYEINLWQSVLSGVKLDTDASQLKEAPTELINFIASTGGD